MTDREDTESRLKQQRDDLNLLNEVMRHDIRNDLQLVQAYAEMLDEHVDEEGQEYLDIIKDSTEHAVDLTTAASDLSEVLLRDTGDLTTVSLDTVLDQQIEQLREVHPEAVVMVEGQLPAVSVVGDEMLSSVFRNLLKNAVQHNDKSPPEVSVSVTQNDETVRVAVADNGPGVPDSQKDKIFGKGEKGLGSSGAGIGLYLVQSLVESYGGDVWVADNDPEGAVFSVELALTD